MNTPKDPAPERPKLSELARDTIREKIVYGTFAFGRVLREADLTAMLGMSKSPVREALLQLEREGLVEMSANRPARVFTLGPEDVTALGSLREMLEEQAIRLAADHAPEALAEVLDRHNRAGAEAVAAGDPAAYTRIDDAFHRAIFDHCGNPYLAQTFGFLAPRIQAMRSRLARERDTIGSSLRDHEAMVEALRTGNGETAAKRLAAHVRANTAAYADWVRQSAPRPEAEPARVLLEEMERFARAALDAAGADAPTREATVRALSHASLLGVDTHGYRLLPHYLLGLRKGRLNPHPEMRFTREAPSVAVLDADDAQGARATYAAVDRALKMARETGTGAVAIRGSSHFGAAGAYAHAIAEAGMAGLCVCNSDAFVRLHGGAERFHGTNPIAFGAYAGAGEPPWLLDMATSAIPFNKVQLFRALRRELPPGTASDAGGVDTVDPVVAQMLAPLGAAFGYKGAGLAGISEILSSALSDAPLSREIAPMTTGGDMTKPRGLGAFVLALDPERFMGRETFGAVIRRYRESIRTSAAAPGGVVMAAGDREWAEARERRRRGIALDPTAMAAFAEFAQEHGIDPLKEA